MSETLLFTSWCCLSHFMVLLHTASRFPCSCQELEHILCFKSGALFWNTAAFSLPNLLGPPLDQAGVFVSKSN